VPEDAQAASVSTAGAGAGAGAGAAAFAERTHGTRPSPARPARLARRHLWRLGALIVILDAAIVGPFIGRGRLPLLDVGDYPESPHPAFVPSAAGFPPGVTNRAPVEAVMYWLFQGIHWSPVYLLPFAALAPLACAGFARLFQGRAAAIGTATVLFTVNPFIYERMANGQLYVLMGYSLLPAILALAVRPLRSVAATAALGGLIFALSVALSVHYLFIGLLMLVTVVLAHLVLRQKRVVQAGAGIAAAGLALSMYWLIPAMRATRTMQSHVTGLDLSAFRTLSDPVWGLTVNVAGLYGFWRPGPPLVKSHLSGWPFLLLAILVVVLAGLREMWGRGPAGRALALSCGVLALVGGLLAAGAEGAAAGLYTWLFEHIPGFKVMREAEKLSALVALGYAAGFGTGAEAIMRPLAGKAARVLCVLCVTAIPLTYGYTELWGFDGYARPSEAPASWAAADRAMAPGATALALPWRAYLPVPWFGNRVVANPVQGYFDRPVISADDTEAGSIATETSDRRSLFLQFCLSEGNRLTEFGRLLAPLGIRYVILAKVPGAQSFAWLSRQHDLRRVFDAGTIAVYENTEAVPAGYEPGRRIVLRDWGQVAALAQRTPLIDYLIQVRRAGPGLLSAPAPAALPQARAPAVMRTAAGTSVTAPVNVHSAARTVVLTNPAYAGWQLPGFRTTTQFGVTVAFTRPGSLSRPARLVATYGPARLVRACDIAGAGLAAADLALLSIGLICARRRDRAPDPGPRREPGLQRLRGTRQAPP
jgi:hypothetical protein